MRRSWRTAVIGTLCRVVVMPAALTFYIAWLWFGETGYQGVFIRTFTAQATLGGSAIAAAFAVLWLNVRVDRRMISPQGAANVGVEVRIELMPRLPLITLIMIPRSPTGFFPRSSCYIC